MINSQHMTGEAADIHIPMVQKSNGSKVQDLDKDKKYLEFILENCRFHQVILEHDKSGTY